MEDAEHARRHLDKVITVNESWRMCSGADVCYGADSAWWLNRGPTPDKFAGERWTQDHQWSVPKPPGMHTMPSKPGCGVAPPGSDFVFTGHNSAFQALGLAVVWGAASIVFLGLDLSPAPTGENHWHDDHPEPLVNSVAAYPVFMRAFQKAAPILKSMGVHVVNASRRTALDAFPRLTIQEACV